jgi:hypothetical protein
VETALAVRRAKLYFAAAGEAAPQVYRCPRVHCKWSSGVDALFIELMGAYPSHTMPNPDPQKKLGALAIPAEAALGEFLQVK